MKGFAGANSPVRIELIKALNEFSAAARSFRVLAEYLENHPEALIKGQRQIIERKRRPIAPGK